MRNYRLLIILTLIVTSGRILAQRWPIEEKDDPKDWNTITCTFAEIHDTGQDHFHMGIDVDANRSGCPVRAVQKGRIYDFGPTSVGVEHEYPPGSGQYNRRTRYLHTKGKIKGLEIGSAVEEGQIITYLKNNKGGYAWHLHFEMYQYEKGIWYALNPFRNDAGWNIQCPKDLYDPEINGVILETIADDKIPSGCHILTSSGAVSAEKSGSVKIHFKDRPGSTGKKFNYKNDKLVVYGNLAPVVSTRDKGINCLVPSGDGLTVYQLRYYIDGDMKFDLTFDRLEKTGVYDHAYFFETAYNKRKSDKYYGNNDFLKLYNINNYYYYPQKKIDGKRSNGVWQTKADKSVPTPSDKISNSYAPISSEALYPDGEHILKFTAEDAAGRKDSCSMALIVDNFYPYVEQASFFSTEKVRDELIYSAYWKYNKKNKSLEYKTGASTKPLEARKGLSIKIKASEPMKEMSIRIPCITNFVEIEGKPEKESNFTEWNFTVSAESLKSAREDKIYINITGRDLAGNPLFGFESTEDIKAGSLPERDKNGDWSAKDINRADKVHFIEMK